MAPSSIEKKIIFFSLRSLDRVLALLRNLATGVTMVGRVHNYIFILPHKAAHRKEKLHKHFLTDNACSMCLYLVYGQL